MRELPIVFPISLAIIVLLLLFTSAYAISSSAYANEQDVCLDAGVRRKRRAGPRQNILPEDGLRRLPATLNRRWSMLVTFSPVAHQLTHQNLPVDL